MTPAQLRAYATVVRHGSVKEAGAELGVTEAAISGHVAQLRKELGDQLFSRTGSGLAFTPGGLRLATRAAEMLGLQDQTVREVREARAGRRVLRLAVSSMFAEYAAPGLIELFSTRADDLAVELSVHPTDRFVALLDGRVADLAVGPPPRGLPPTMVQTTFLKYEVVAVCGPGHPAGHGRWSVDALREHTWLVGPSATEADDVVARLVTGLGVPDENQRIFQSHAAAVQEAKRDNGIALALAFTVADDIRRGSLVQVSGACTQAAGAWSAMTLSPPVRASAASELMRFITTPRATQAMLHGEAARVTRFKPAVHVTLWS